MALFFPEIPTMMLFFALDPQGLYQYLIILLNKSFIFDAK
jgi:hypothetical protein